MDYRILPSNPQCDHLLFNFRPPMLIRPLAKVELTPLNPPETGEEILLPLLLLLGEGWGGVSRIYARGLLWLKMNRNSQENDRLFDDLQPR